MRIIDNPESKLVLNHTFDHPNFYILLFKFTIFLKTPPTFCCLILQSEQELRQKLVDTTLELETMKNVKVELFNLLMMAYQERDEARFQVQKLMNKLIMPSSTPIPLQNVPGGVLHQENLLTMFPSAKANPSITESNSLSHGSPPVDSFFDNVSSPQEFSNINAVDNNSNMSYLKQQHMVQDFNLVSSENPASDPASAVIECLAKEKVLPQKGNLLQAVIDAGPLLQTLLLAGPLPSWQNPPPLGDIKVPSLNIKEHTTITIEPNSFVENSNLLLKPKLPSLQSSNALSTCSASMLNFSGHSHSLGSWNNPWKFQAPSRKRQRHH